MRKYVFSLVLFAGANATATPPQPPKLPNVAAGVVPAKRVDLNESQVIKFNFQGASVAEIVNLVYLEAFTQAYVIDPAILKDERKVAFRFDASRGDLRQFWIDFMEALGFAVQTRNGVDFLVPKKVEEKTEIEPEVFVYRTQYRSLSYLVGLLTPIFKANNFTTNRTVRAPAGDKGTPNVPVGSAAAAIDQDSDVMIFQGTAKEVEKLKILLPQIDTASGEVVVKAVVYEVTTTKNDGNAFSLAINILNGRLGLSMGTSTANLGSGISFKTTNIDAAFSALSSDSRFRTVSAPRLRVKSGSQARLTVGADVPTLGAVSYPQGGGAAVQSIEYRSSGVILSFSPEVRDLGIDVQVDQQISDFSVTDTGVNNSPTLTKRALTTTVTVGEGEVVLLGGLTLDKKNDSRSGFSFIPKLFQSAAASGSSTEILLLMQVLKVPR